MWLVPFYTYNANEAAVRFQLIIQDNGDSSLDDLAKGAGGAYRYLKAIADGTNPNKITDLALQRSGNSVAFPSGANSTYSGHTGDINQGRKKDYLYLLWATRAAF